jgi:imidazolonepropionase-like amidohydrolase
MGQYNVGEIKQLVDVLGMTPLEAITSATKFGAEACGIEDKVGTIEQGKMADLLVVKKDPSADIDTLLDKDNIKYVIKEGKLAAGY